MIKKYVIFCVMFVLLFTGIAGAEIIFDEDFNDTTSAIQADLVSAVGTGTWIEVAIDTSTILTGTTKYMNAARGDYDYAAVFTHYGSVADGGTITMDLSFGDSVHDYNTVYVLEGTNELFRIEVHTDDGGADGTDAQINLVGATTENIGGGIAETSPPNRTFLFTLDATGVDLSIDGGTTYSVDYSFTPSIGPDRIRIYKNDFFGNSDRGQLRIDDMVVDFTATVARVVLIDYDDGNAGNGIHDSAVKDGDFSGQSVGTSISAPWQCISSTPEFYNDNAPGIGSALNAGMVKDRVYAVDPGHTLALGDVFIMQFFWRDAWLWDPADTVEMVLYYTDTDAIDGTATEVFSLSSGPRNVTAAWEGEYGTSPSFSDGSGVGKKLFVKLEVTNPDSGEFARIDNIFLEVIAGPAVPLSGSVFRFR